MKNRRRLRTKLITIMALITILPALTSGILALLIYGDTLKQQVFINNTTEAEHLQNTVDSLLTAIKNDVLFLTQAAPLLDYLSTRALKLSADNQKSQSDDPTVPPGTEKAASQALTNVLERKLQTLEQEFLAFSRYHGLYYQLIYIDETGQEMVRVMIDGSRIKLSEREKLKNQSQQDDFKQTMLLSGKQLLISPIHLSREQGQLESPLKAVIKYVANVYHENERKAGIIVLTVDANQLFRGLESHSYLVDQNGFFIVHSTPKICWGGAADLNTKYTLADEYPEFAKSLLGQDNIVNTDTVSLFSRVIRLPNSSQQWTLITSRPTLEVFKDLWRFRLIFASILLLSVTFMLLLAWWFSRRITRPLEELLQIAKLVSTGEKLDKRIEISAPGEIGELVQAFERMRISLLKSFERLRKPSSN